MRLSLEGMIHALDRASWLTSGLLLGILLAGQVRAEQVCADIIVELSTTAYRVPDPIPTRPTKEELWKMLKAAEHARDSFRREWLEAVSSNIEKDGRVAAALAEALAARRREEAWREAHLAHVTLVEISTATP